MTRNSICQASFWAALLRSVDPTHAHACTQPLFTRQIRHFALTPPCRSARQGVACSDQPPSPLLSASTGTSSSSPSVPLQVHFSAKKRNHSSWTEEADTLLLDLRAQGKTWIQIGQVLGKSRQACNRRFDAVLDPENGATFWTLQADRNQTLLQLVAQGLGWKQIADRLRTKASACEKQWRILEQERIASAATAAVVAQDVQGNPSMTTQSSRVQGQPSMETMTTPSRFPVAEVQLLKNAVADYGDNQWEWIAEQVFRSRFSPTFLRRQHIKLERTRRIWTEQQEAHLLTEIKSCYQRNHLPTPSPAVPSSLDALSESQWESVACTIPGDHSPAECRERWLRIHLNTTGQRTQKNSLIILANTNDENKANAQTSHDNNRTSWSPEQSRRLEVIASHVKDDSTGGIDWDKVSELMNREFTKHQCKSRWNRILSRAKCTSGGPWDNKEIECLVQGVCEFGDQWTKISEHWIPGRTPSFIQGKWKAIVGKLNQNMVIRRWTWPEACVASFGQSLGKPLGDLSSRWPKLCQSSRHSKDGSNT